jgi:TRAP-type mannitol/chloroaromatic compound transport system permease small subunit
VLEGSGDPGGLPARYILKAAIPIGFFLLALQGFSRIGGFFVRRDGAKRGGGGDA